MGTEEQRSALMTALSTEHFVLQTAASSTISESAARSSLYVFSLSSSLVAMGFTAQSREIFVPFAATVLPALFLLGVFTVIRLVDTALENMQYLSGIARIRSYYRTLGSEAAAQFAAETGRWPEAKAPSLRLGPFLAILGTTATMIAFINNVVAGVGIALLAGALFGDEHHWLALSSGIASAVLLSLAFLAYQRWRFRVFDNASPVNAEP
jgi:hypothetical protein